MLALTSAAATDTTLLSAAEVRAALGGVNPTNEQVAELRARASALIAQVCRVPGAGVSPPTLRVEGVTETFRLKSHHDTLILSRRPIVSIVSVTENGAAVASTDYEIEVGAGMLQRLSSDSPTCWPCGKIVVVYTAGWATVPDDLKLAAARLAAHLWAEPEDSNVKREVIPGVREVEYWVEASTGLAIPREVTELLGPYMNHVVG